MRKLQMSSIGGEIFALQQYQTFRPSNLEEAMRTENFSVILGRFFRKFKDSYNFKIRVLTKKNERVVTPFAVCFEGGNAYR